MTIVDSFHKKSANKKVAKVPNKVKPREDDLTGNMNTNLSELPCLPSRVPFLDHKLTDEKFFA